MRGIAGAAVEHRLGAVPARQHGGEDSLGGEGVGEPERVPDEEGAVAVARFEVGRVEEVVGVPFHVLQRLACARRHVAAVEEVAARGAPGRAHLIGGRGAGAHVQPPAIGHVPRVAAEVVVEQELRLAVSPDARGSDLRGVDLEFALLRGDRVAGLGGEKLARDRTVRAARADEPSRRVRTIDGPQPLPELERLRCVAVDHRCPTAPEEEMIELPAPDEVPPRRDAVALAAVLNVAAAPWPQAARVLTTGELEHLPHRRAQPPAAQLDAREPSSIDDGHAQPTAHQDPRACAPRRAAAHDDGVERGRAGRHERALRSRG